MKKLKVSKRKTRSIQRNIHKKSSKKAVTLKQKCKDVEVVVPTRLGRKPSIEKMYFTKDTESAIIAYNKESEHSKREEIYNTKIKFPFEKLVENIFNTFKFSYFQVGTLDVQKETLTHLVSNMEKYEENKGKAFSYFSIIAKNYLIFHNNNNYKQFSRMVDITENHEDHGVQLQVTDKHHEHKQTKEFLNLVVSFWDDNLTKIFKKQRDLCIAQSVVELLRRVDNISLFNKKALYLYIREISNCKTTQITKIINKMKPYQKQITENYLNRGHLKSSDE